MRELYDKLIKKVFDAIAITIGILSFALLLALPKCYYELFGGSGVTIAAVVLLIIWSYFSEDRYNRLLYYSIYHTLFFVAIIHYGIKNSAYLYAIVVLTISEVILVIRFALYTILSHMGDHSKPD